MIAELVPFGCLAIGFAIAREWRPVNALGYLIALFGMPILTAFYLYKVLGAAIGWVVPLIPLQHDRCNLPRNKFEAYARSRGTLAWLWLPR